MSHQPPPLALPWAGAVFFPRPLDPSDVIRYDPCMNTNTTFAPITNLTYGATVATTYCDTPITGVVMARRGHTINWSIEEVTVLLTADADLGHRIIPAGETVLVTLHWNAAGTAVDGIDVTGSDVAAADAYRAAQLRGYIEWSTGRLTKCAAFMRRQVESDIAAYRAELATIESRGLAA